MKLHEHRIVGLGCAALLLYCIVGIAQAQAAPLWDQDQLTWVNPTQCVDGSPITACPLTGIRIQTAATATAATWTLVTDAAPTAQAFLVTGLSAGPHCYRLISLSATANSSATTPVCTTTVTPTPNPPSGLTVDAPTAFNVRPNLQRFVFERGASVGTIRLGSACDATRCVEGGYCAISRPSRVVPRPAQGTVLLAHCA